MHNFAKMEDQEKVGILMLLHILIDLKQLKLILIVTSLGKPQGISKVNFYYFHSMIGSI